jgi:RHS repeat-associated protein
VWKGEFAPFGQEIDTQTTANNYKFTGKERDTESGLDYFGARHYGSSMGRFMSPDDADGSFSNPNVPQNWNLYAYVQNNPLTNVDPDGHDCVVQSRVDDHHETVSISSGNCNGVKLGSGQSATYVPGTVTGYSVNGGNSLDIGYNSSDGQSSGIVNAKAAPAFDNPGIDGPANAAIFGQIGSNVMGGIKAFTVGSVALGVTGGAGLAAFGGEIGGLTTVSGLSDAAASQAPKLIIRTPQLLHAMRVALGHNTPLGTPTEIRLAIQAALVAGSYGVGPNGVTTGVAIIQGVAHEFTGFMNGSQFIFSNIYRQVP